MNKFKFTIYYCYRKDMNGPHAHLTHTKTFTRSLTENENALLNDPSNFQTETKGIKKAAEVYFMAEQAFHQQPEIIINNICVDLIISLDRY